MATLCIIFSAKLDKHNVGACTVLESRLYEDSIGYLKFTSSGILCALICREIFFDLLSAK